MTKPINVFIPKFRTSEVLKEIKECLDCGWTGMGYKTVEFEAAWSEYTGLKNSLFISSNTAGLHLALRVLAESYNWEKDSEIITTPFTFVSTNHSILYEGLIPSFSDINDHLCLDIDSVEKSITDKTKAIMYVGIGGNPGRLDELKSLCDNYDLKLILDAAHMSGTLVNASSQGSGKPYSHVGDEADVSIFSFQAVKNLPTADSGMICFKKKALHEKAKKLSWLGIDTDTFSRTSIKTGDYKWKYNVPSLGYKYNGNSIMAAIGLVQLRYLDEDNKKRNEIADIYDSLIEESSILKKVPMSSYCYRSSRHLYQIRIKNGKRDRVMQSFYEKEIYPGVHYIDNTNYPMYKNSKGKCPNAALASDEIISLPLHLNITVSDVQKVTDTLLSSIKSFI